MDINFIKQFGMKGSTFQQFHQPLGITFHEDSIYVCDGNNKRIQKLSRNLNNEDSYPLKFEPWDIKIIKNVPCIRPYSDIYGQNVVQLETPFKCRQLLDLQFCRFF